MNDTIKPSIESFTTEKYRIEPARTEHLASLPAIEKSAAVLFPRELFPERLIYSVLPVEIYREAMALGRLWVAVEIDSNEPVGFALLRDEQGEALLEEVDVLPEHGRQGLGRKLVEAAISGTKGSGAGFLYLTTFRSVPWNAPFYQSLGFIIVPVKGLPTPIRRILDEEQAKGLIDRVGM